MNLDDYKEAMREIPVNPEELEAKLYERINTKRVRNDKNKVRSMIPVMAIAIALSLVLLLLDRNPFDIPVISVKVYAAEQEVIDLSRRFVAIDTQAQPFFGGYTIDANGNYVDASITYNIHFLCEGEGIESITYLCSDQEVNRSNRSQAAAYYVENITLPVEKYKSLPSDKGEDFICGFFGEGDESATIIRLIGSSYTVNYANQENIDYGLVVAAKVESESEFHCEDLVITAKLRMKDGSVITKRFLLAFGEDAFSDVQIKILK